MGLLSRSLIAFGLLCLAHASPANHLNSGYSVHEFSLLYGSPQSIPLDITLETLAAVLLVTLGLVLGSEQLKPITWSVWAGEIEAKGGYDNPFRAYEDGLGFWDVRAKRKEFADWVKQQDDTTQKTPSSS